MGRQHNRLIRAFLSLQQIDLGMGSVSGGCIFHITKDSRWVNPPTRSEMKHFLIKDQRPSTLHILTPMLSFQSTCCTCISSMVIISVQVRICGEDCPRVAMKPGWHLPQVMSSISSIDFQDRAYLFPGWWLSWQMYLSRMASNNGTITYNGLCASEPGKQV